MSIMDTPDTNYQKLEIPDSNYQQLETPEPEQEIKFPLIHWQN